jgi:hypothetical protein
MLAFDQAGAQRSQSPVTADKGGDGTSVLSWFQSRWSLLLTFENSTRKNGAGAGVTH